RMSAQLDQAEEAAARDLLDAVLAAGERGAQAEEVEHLRQREGDHREVDPLAPDRQRADDQAERGRGDRRAEDGELRVPAPALRRVRREVAGGAEVEGVAEGEQAGVPEQEIERAGEEREAERLHQEDRIDDPRRDRDQRDEDDRRDALRLRPRLDPLDRRAHAVFPKSPAGRTRRTIAITTKITVFEASG